MITKIKKTMGTTTNATQDPKKGRQDANQNNKTRGRKNHQKNTSKRKHQIDWPQIPKPNLKKNPLQKQTEQIKPTERDSTSFTKNRKPNNQQQLKEKAPQVDPKPAKP